MAVAIKISTRGRSEMVDITALVKKELDNSGKADGMCLVYIPHTTAGVTINEGADPDVKSDILAALSEMVPATGNYRHAEGNSDSHIKAALVGSSVVIPIQNAKLLLGTWQSIFFCEFDGPRSRSALIQFI
ncbi:MAG: hypothetical protein COZ70_12380 [Deltaproteobacteria bacterium CG_4_8_14_3_um_filter_51_11]|nr:YjbQ family protein [bacterium]OIP40403.1 MAG: hypothetical protein AUK25_07665 [Desulfobacteraceae bacterium CG2_30_51_40]PIP44903.1 MAG: hypothetical protein COX16_16060 [Deltaproteobacteria bacterium CG23_combo_of_CG06-09_8_20_14_all_51_20]PIV99263.1 MAG: hypothetical protein COW41_08430 [Deltaproteobacteria bacterium CG17_big_fil_post_rev_8_21_14_2_50_51_6]PIX18787.1 MAG: hypothetical protein COZ70_12380 [Deltaproteobacteria bacterium CG_4_8_14_3_um_filter_51_11]PIY26903.1 MAG: hypothet